MEKERFQHSVPKEMIERQATQEERQASLPRLVKKVTQDYMLIEKLPKESAIIITADEKTKEPELYRVKEVGPGHYDFGKFIEPSVKKGDVVFIMGPSAVIKVKDRVYQFARCRDVVAFF